MTRIYALLLFAGGLLVGFLSGSLTPAAYSDQQAVDYQHPVAQVGATVITRSQLAEAAILAGGKELLTRDLQAQALVTEAARRAQVTVSADEIAQEVTAMLTYAHNAMASPKYQYIPRILWNDYARTVLLAQKMMGIANVSEVEARSYFMKNPSGFVAPASAKLICISTETRTKANEVLKRLQAGEDPNALSALYTTDPALRQARGEMNWVTARSLGPEASAKIFGDNLKPGQWTDVIKYEYVDPEKYNNHDPNPMTSVFAIFFVKERNPEYTPKFEEVKAAAMYAARMVKQKEEMPKWMAGIAVDIGKDWKTAGNLYDPTSSLQPAPIDPAIYHQQPINTVPNM
jgi:parvulin-like peptidyl-prolyl isomerase